MSKYNNIVVQIASFFQSIDLNTYIQIIIAIGSILAVLVSIKALREPLRTQLGIYPIHRKILKERIPIEQKRINKAPTAAFINIKNNGHNIIEDLKTSIKVIQSSDSYILSEEHSPAMKIFDLQKIYTILYNQRIKDLEQTLSLPTLPQDTTHTVFFGNIVTDIDYFDNIIYCFPYKNTWRTHFISQEIQIPYTDCFDIYRIKIPKLYSILAMRQLTEKLFEKEYLYKVFLYLQHYEGEGKKYLENGIYNKKWNIYVQKFLEILMENGINHEIGKNYLIELSRLLNNFAVLNESDIKQVEHICKIITNAYEQIFKKGIQIYLPNCLVITVQYKNTTLNEYETKEFPIDILKPIKDID